MSETAQLVSRKRSWRSQDLQKPWYPITALTRAHVTVELALQEGWEIIGRIGRHPETRAWAWYELKPNGRTWALLAPYRVPEPGRAPRRREPVAWRPLPWTRWPDPLPEPLTGARRLELFSRASRPGWETWGDEAGKFDGETGEA